MLVFKRRTGLTPGQYRPPLQHRVIREGQGTNPGKSAVFCIINPRKNVILDNRNPRKNVEYANCNPRKSVYCGMMERQDSDL